MNDSMFKLDTNIIKNLDMFTFNDKEEVYTNGNDLISVFRVIQIIEAMKLQDLVEREIPKPPIFDEFLYRLCPNCKQPDIMNVEYYIEYKRCTECGQLIDWSKDPNRFNNNCVGDE
jgi:hypothetical protein